MTRVKRMEKKLSGHFFPSAVHSFPDFFPLCALCEKHFLRIFQSPVSCISIIFLLHPPGGARIMCAHTRHAIPTETADMPHPSADGPRRDPDFLPPPQHSPPWLSKNPGLYKIMDANRYGSSTHRGRWSFPALHEAETSPAASAKPRARTAFTATSTRPGNSSSNRRSIRQTVTEELGLVNVGACMVFTTGRANR